MNKKFLLIAFLLPVVFSLQAQNTPTDNLRKIYDEALLRGKSYAMLEYLATKIGNRLSGSPQAAAAVEWSRQQMQSLNFDTVYLQPVMVPHWKRGDVEIGKIIGSRRGDIPVRITSLGNSIGTGPKGILAEVIEVKGLEELALLGKKKIENKIVFFNRPMDARLINTEDAYSGAVDQRSAGASEAYKFGAKGVIVRSMTLASDDVPHTGMLKYEQDAILPAVAISTKDADLLSGLLKDNEQFKFYLENHCQMLDSVLSYNVFGEIRGNQKPEEIISVGGHLDSWDVGQGAHDDGSGCVQAIEALRILKALNLKPQRTLRAVMFMNEENGVMGGKVYAKAAKEKGEKHKVAIESDTGGFLPIGFNYEPGAGKLQDLNDLKKDFEPYQLYSFKKADTGTDIEQLRDTGVFLIGLYPDSQRYFNIHHTEADTFDKVDQRELELGAAAIASLIYLLDLKDEL